MRQSARIEDAITDVWFCTSSTWTVLAAEKAPTTDRVRMTGFYRAAPTSSTTTTTTTAPPLQTPPPPSFIPSTITLLRRPRGERTSSLHAEPATGKKNNHRTAHGLFRTLNTRPRPPPVQSLYLPTLSLCLPFLVSARRRTGYDRVTTTFV